jgi:DNA repair exonuclease SbcCD ATPase subunit
MTTSTSRPKRQRRSWFAPRQVYLRAGQDSSYVELSTTLQASVAIGIGVIVLWLVGASYSALSNVLDKSSSARLASKLETTEGKLVEITEVAAKIPSLEAALADARTEVAEAQQVDETTALSAELEATKGQLEELRQQLSTSKAEEATLQARLEALTAVGNVASEQPGEEASSLHAQLEEAFSEIEALEQARDEADARAAALTAEIAASDADAERNDTLLQAATEEIERLQETIIETSGIKKEQEAEHQGAIERLTAMLDEERSAKEALKREADRLAADLERQNGTLAASLAQKMEAEAERYALAIEAGLKEAELSATIEAMRAESQAPAAAKDDGGEDVEALKAELAAAEAEIETILKNTLTSAGKEEEAKDETALAVASPPASLAEIKRLETELASAQGDIIKLKSDVRTARKRLAEQAEAEVTTVLAPDQSGKLQQQLTSTRSRIQQLTKALADAKLREVAIDLALINVVPSPSPRAPR